MLKSQSIFILMICLSMSAQAIERCGTKQLSLVTALSVQAKSISDCTYTLTQVSEEYWPQGLTLQIPIYFHVIHKVDGEGNVTEEAINAQITVLNEDFAALAGSMGENGYNTKIQFTLQGITRTENDIWFEDDSELEYKEALSVNANNYLNVYTTSASQYGTGTLGYAYLPQPQFEGGEPIAGTTIDGVVMLHSTIGGRDNGYSVFDQGRTLVHEIGHSFGLFHTFDTSGGTCENSYIAGDLIVDTPAHSSPDYTCAVSTSCGVDSPIHNYMNYTPDDCMDRFSPEQANRMVCSIMNYRPDLFTLIDNGTNQLINPSVLMYLLQN